MTKDTSSLQSETKARTARRSSSLTPHPSSLAFWAAALLAAAVLSGCGSAPKREQRVERGPAISKAPSSSPPRARGGGYYLDDGPADAPPADLETIPEPVPKLEPLHRGAMRPYIVMGQSYTPMTELTPYKAQGVATWYGRRYHGRQTSSGERYDMYSMSAAHPVLPLPSYVRVTNLANGKSVVVRVNDRGPFIDNRLIDLSYTAAHRIGVLAGGSAVVEVESIIPDGSAPGTAYAAAPASTPRAAVGRPQPAPTPVPVARAATTPLPEPNAPAADPILAIAAAAREVDPVPRPLAEPQAAATALARAGAPEPGGLYLQLGAFGSRENAESYLARARLQVEWLSERLHVLAREGLYRVHAGPYATPGEARQAAERIGLALGMKPVVVMR